MLGYVKQDKFHIRDFNFRLLAYVLVLSIIGILVVNSATKNEVTQSLISTTVKQIVGVGVGIVLMSLFALFDYHKFVKYAWVFYLLAILALIYLLAFGKSISGAKRWIHIPLFGTIQPSEFAKPALLLFQTFIALKLKDNLSKIYGILLYLLGAAPVLGMVLMEPDLSTAIVLMIIIVTVLFLAGLSYKWIIGAAAVLLPFVVVFFIALYQPDQSILHSIFKDHQVDRINAFFFPQNYPDLVRQ